MSWSLGRFECRSVVIHNFTSNETVKFNGTPKDSVTSLDERWRVCVIQ